MEVSGSAPNLNQHFLLQARIMTEEIEEHPTYPPATFTYTRTTTRYSRRAIATA